MKDWRWARRLVVASGTVVVVLSLFASSSLARTFTASPSIADTDAASSCAHACSLRQAVAAAVKAGGNETIDLPTGNYRLSTAYGAIAIAPTTAGLNLTLAGQGSTAVATVIHGDGADRVFTIGNGTATVKVTMSTLEITGGETNPTYYIQGAGAWVQTDATLVLDDDVVAHDAASTSGGGVDSDGSLTVTDSLFLDDSAGDFGGAIDSFGTATVRDSTLYGSSAYESAAINVGAPMQVIGSTIVDSQGSTGSGGAGALGGTAADLTLTGSILADSTSHDLGDCESIDGFSIVSGGHNVIDDGSCTGSVGSDLVATDPKLAGGASPLLADNGGPTETVALEAASSAIGEVPAASCDATDQRGYRRLVGGAHACDAGAYERNGVPAVPVLIGPDPSISGDAAVGHRLTCAHGGWDGSPTAYAYRWYLGRRQIAGARSSRYTVKSADRGRTLACVVTASNAGGASKPARSAGVKVRSG